MSTENTQESLEDIKAKFTPELSKELNELHLVVISPSKNETDVESKRYNALTYLRDAALFAAKALALDPETENEEKADDNYAAQAFRLNGAYIEKS